MDARHREVHGGQTSCAGNPGGKPPDQVSTAVVEAKAEIASIARDVRETHGFRCAIVNCSWLRCVCEVARCSNQLPVGGKFTSTRWVAHLTANGCDRVGVLGALGARRISSVSGQVSALQPLPHLTSVSPQPRSQVSALQPLSALQSFCLCLSGQVRWLSVFRITFKHRPSPRGPWHGVLLRVSLLVCFSDECVECVECVVALFWRARHQSARRQGAFANWVRLARTFRRLRRRKR